MNKLKNIWENITVEPVFFFFMLGIGMFAITGQELYIQKACRVNFNFTEEICENIQNETLLANLGMNDTQKMIQKFVAEIQAYNGILQSIPPILFTLYAGPLSDKYGRKPLIVMAFLGYIIQNIVYLINVIWFHELKVEWLLFECLQDMTGGSIVLGMGLYALMVDYTTEENRTKRMAVLDAFVVLGMAIGFGLGMAIKSRFGWMPLYVASMFIILGDMIYVVFCLKDVNVKQNKNQDDVSQHSIGRSKRTLRTVLELTLTGVKCIFKERQEGKRTWILFFIVIMTIQKLAEQGWQAVGLLFFKLQYNGGLKEFSILMMFFSFLTIISQLVIIPFISGRLKWRDTTILIIATSTSTIGYLIYGLGHDLWVMIISYIFFAFYGNINSTSRSLLSKMVDPSEIGATLAMVGILQAIMALIGKPLYAFVYKATIDFLPATFVFFSTILFGIILVLITFAHFRLRRCANEKGMPVQRPLEKESRILKNNALKVEEASLSASLLNMAPSSTV